eukprot:TRINITY_DN11114_c0_g1_i1.p1 TRINITY_DN11114_c0_g1~~TRINITY_DN11114_c0_g1_i1.p1  ORF type:complete len:451 (-),score=9.80 TRINITY_DN11114_c0_g1_i1:20-1345(-)
MNKCNDGIEPEHEFDYVRVLTNYIPRRKGLALLENSSVEEVYQFLKGRVLLSTLGTWKSMAIKGSKPYVIASTTSMCPQIEERLYKWYKEKREQGELPTANSIQEEALKLQERFPTSTRITFSRNWVRTFLRRYKIPHKLTLGYHCGSSRDMLEDVHQFYGKYNAVIRQYDGNGPSDIWVYDEMFLELFPQMVCTYDLLDNMPGSYRPARITMAFAVSFTGKIAPPVLIFNSHGFKPFSIPGFEDALIVSNSRPIITEECNYDHVLPHVLKYMEHGTLLVYSDKRSNISIRIGKLFEDKGVKAVRAPNGCYRVLSPISAFFTKSIKENFKLGFLSWLIDNYEKITTELGTFQSTRDNLDNKLLAYWALRAWGKVVNREVVLANFPKTGLTSNEMQKEVMEKRVPESFGEKAIKEDNSVEPKETIDINQITFSLLVFSILLQ